MGLLQLSNDKLKVGLTNYGARMLSIEAPDRNGRLDHVLLGFDHADMILRAGSFGAVLGRYANRIAKGRFTLDGEKYELSVNDGENTLHGGRQAFAKRFWTVAYRTRTQSLSGTMPLVVWVADCMPSTNGNAAWASLGCTRNVARPETSLCSMPMPASAASQLLTTM